MRRHTFLLPLLVIALTLPLAAQIPWELTRDGTEGGHIRRFHRTPAGTLLGTSGVGIVRFDASERRWSSVLDSAGGLGIWSFGSDSAGTIYATSFGPTLRSTDDGRTWTRIDSTTSWVAAREGRTVALLGMRGRSTDGGATWQWSNRVAPWPATWLPDGRIIAGYDTLMISSDTGRTWTHQPQAVWHANDYAAIGDSTILIAQAGGLLRSTDAGATWTRPEPSLPFDRIVHDGRGVLYGSSFNGNASLASDGLYRSLDSGRSWTLVARGTPWGLGAGAPGEIWAGFTPEILRTTDGGVSWSHESAGLYRRSWTVLSAPDQSIYALLDGRRINRENGGYVLTGLAIAENDAASWRMVLDSVLFVHVVPNSSTLVARLGRPAYRADQMPDEAWRTVASSDRGATWRPLVEGPAGEPRANASGLVALPVFLAPGEPNLLLSTDGLASWRTVTFGDSAYCLKTGVTPSGRIYATTYRYRDATTYSRVLRSDDTGRTWTPILERFNAGTLHAVGDETLVLIGDADTVHTSTRTLRSSDGGATWSTVVPSMRLSYTVQLASGTIVAAGYEADSTYFRRSDDGGATWQTTVVRSTRNAATYWPHAPTLSANGAEVFFPIGGDLYHSTDDGVTWTLIAEASSQQDWRSATSNDRVIVGAAGNLWRSILVSTVAIDRGSDDATALALSVAPVPATDRIAIEHDGRGGTLRIVDMTGHVVHSATIAAGRAGRHVVAVDGLSDGIYLVDWTGPDARRVGRFVIEQR